MQGEGERQYNPLSTPPPQKKTRTQMLYTDV